jgi:hypothetical protein
MTRPSPQLTLGHVRNQESSREKMSEKNSVAAEAANFVSHTLRAHFGQDRLSFTKSDSKKRSTDLPSDVLSVDRIAARYRSLEFESKLVFHADNS